MKKVENLFYRVVGGINGGGVVKIIENKGAGYAHKLNKKYVELYNNNHEFFMAKMRNKFKKEGYKVVDAVLYDSSMKATARNNYSTFTKRGY